MNEPLAKKLLEALVEARAWLAAGRPADRGAKCETIGDAEALVWAAIAAAMSQGLNK